MTLARVAREIFNSTFFCANIKVNYCFEQGSIIHLFGDTCARDARIFLTEPFFVLLIIEVNYCFEQGSIPYNYFGTLASVAREDF